MLRQRITGALFLSILAHENGKIGLLSPDRQTAR
jgi:hypothetical protein